MIDVKNANKTFDEFVSKYDMNNEKINLKYYHTYRVCDRMNEICDSIGLTGEKKDLAYLIALFHDLGRFEQIKMYDTFNDKNSVDHSLLAIDVLFSKNQIRKYITNDKYDKLIAKAVYNHNKYEIKDCKDEELLYAKLVRDADKLDILYNIAILGGVKLTSDDSKISKSVSDDFNNNRCVCIPDKETINDKVLVLLSLIFDLNFDYSYEYIRKNKLIEKMKEKVNNEMLNEYFDKAIEFIKRK